MSLLEAYERGFKQGAALQPTTPGDQYIRQAMKGPGAPTTPKQYAMAKMNNGAGLGFGKFSTEKDAGLMQELNKRTLNAYFKSPLLKNIVDAGNSMGRRMHQKGYADATDLLEVPLRGIGRQLFGKTKGYYMGKGLSNMSGEL